MHGLSVADFTLNCKLKKTLVSKTDVCLGNERFLLEED